MTAEADRRRDPDRPRRLRPRFRQLQICFIDQPQRPAALLVIEAPGIGQAEAARRPLQQPHPDLALERGDAAADRGLGHAEQAGGGSEAAGLDHAGEHLDVVEIEHCVQEWDSVSRLCQHYGPMRKAPILLRWERRSRPMSTKRHVLVTGATGQQGGAVAAALLSRGHRVTALTRKPDGEAARRLAAAGAAILAGDLGDAASVRQAAARRRHDVPDGQQLRGRDGGGDPPGDHRRRCSQGGRIGHLIYSSVGDADKNTGVPHFDSKFRVERHIAGLGILHTVSAPVAFMENAVAPWSIGGLRQGVHAFALPPKACRPAGGRGRYRRLRRHPGGAARAGVRPALQYRRGRAAGRGAGEDPVAGHRPARSPIRRSRSPRCGSRARIRR